MTFLQCARVPSVIARNYVSVRLNGWADTYLTGLTWEEKPYKHFSVFLQDLEERLVLATPIFR